MAKSVLFAAALALAAGTVSAAAWAAPPDKATLSVENGASRIVDCAVVVDGKMRTLLKIRPGKAWSDDFDPRRDVRLVCERAKKNFWRLEAGATYRLEDAGNRRVDLAEAG